LERYNFHGGLPAWELARIYSDLGEVGLAAQYWARVGACMELNRAASAAIQGRAWQDAVTLAQAGLSACPYDGVGVDLLAQALQGTGNSIGAISLLDDALTNAPHPEPAWWITTARIQETLGDWDGALASCQRALQSTPASADAYLCMGRSLSYGKGQPEAAIPFLRRAVELDPRGNVWRYIVLGDAYLGMQDYTAAEEAYQAGAEAVPESEVPLVWLARLYLMRGNFSVAEYHLKLALARQPDSGLAHSEYGIMLQAQGRTAEAIEEIQVALEIQPDDVVTLLSLARAYESIGEHNQAVEIYKRVIYLDTNNSEAILALETLSK
jgi:tetratricopeptide (TPR) repeat protein